MSTDLAIAAVKAQALWDAGEQLRRQAAELHPEFARLLALSDPGALDDLYQRTRSAISTLDEMTWDDTADQARIAAKRDGVKLVLSYIDEARRMAAFAGDQS